MCYHQFVLSHDLSNLPKAHIRIKIKKLIFLVNSFDLIEIGIKNKKE